ncbi:MAG TPA: hypothetical protein VM575_08895 [Nocardioides sp.]|jgi:hypothetical protein|nr:hypothetical protein [Nocardioides sp.]
MTGVARLGRDLWSPMGTVAADEADLAAGSGLLDRISAADAALLDGPHILVCTDTDTGTTTYTGPYPSGYDAVASLADLESGQQPHPGARTVRCTLAPLLPG